MRAVERQPELARRSTRLREAYEFALEAHHGSRRRGDTDIDHPVAVAAALAEYGLDDEELLAAAFLHDVLEDTDTDPEEIGDGFGDRVRRLVEVMTEDPGIESYVERKAEHRRRVVADDDAAAIYAADKLARCRALGRDPDGLTPEQLDHSAETLRLLRQTPPDLPLLTDLRVELQLLRDRAQATSPRRRT